MSTTSWCYGCAILLVALTLRLAWAAPPPVRIWLLPFDNAGAGASLAYLQEALPALLAVALSRSERHAVIDRGHVQQILAEQSLTLEGLTSPYTRHRIGRLLGATVIVSGSFVPQGQDVLLSMRVADVETGLVTATAAARGPLEQLGPLVSELYRKLGRELGGKLPDVLPGQIDRAPLANLHFMRGLGYYYAARYHQALAEFMQAADEAELRDLARLWLANTYLAQAAYAHAYVELHRLTPESLKEIHRAEVEAGLRTCEAHLSADEAAFIRELAARQAPTGK